MNGALSENSIVLDLSIDDGSFDFSTSIDEAIDRAESELVVLRDSIDSIKELKPDCDKLDYILAASSGALCGLIDIFLVGKPGESSLGKITDKWIEDRINDFAKLCNPAHRDFDSHESAVRFLENKFKVPYDQTGLGDAGIEVFGLNAKNHHFKSLAHNPSLLGLFFSTLDQFSNSSHFVTDGNLISLHNADKTWKLDGKSTPAKLLRGLANWIGHLISDASGSRSSARSGHRGMGIPSPLWSWVNDIIAIKDKLGIPASEIDKALSELATNIFEKGFDLRFQVAQAIPVFVNELFVRLIYAIRRLFKYFFETPKAERSFSLMWQKCEPFSNATVKRMLTVAHGTFCLVDIGDATARAFAGSFNVVDFALRLNIAGIGRFAISLYGETKRAFSYRRAKQDADFTSRRLILTEGYIEGLKILSAKYDDAQLLQFIGDLEKSEAYLVAFKASAALAELREVPESRILKSKADIDRRFGGK